METKDQIFKGKQFTVIKGMTHPSYSYFTFEGEENEFRNKYWNIKENDVVFDIGSSYGSYALTACALGAKVYAFEPEQTVFSDLISNIAINKWQDKCLAFNTGLWSSVGLVNMKDYAPHWPQHTITSNYVVNTIDNIVKTNNINKLDWLKVDVEGAEEHVIKGAIHSIKRFLPKLIIECHVFLDKELNNKIKNLLFDVYDFEEINIEPRIMLIGTPKKNLEVKKRKKIFVVSSGLNTAARPMDFWFNNIWVSSRGLTGSDLAFVRIAQELNKLGHEVSLFTTHAQSYNKPEVWDGMKLFNMEDWAVEVKKGVDVAISINDPNVFFDVPKDTKRILLEFLNDFPFARPGWEDQIDLGFGVCEEHTNHLKGMISKPEKWGTLELGCDPELYKDDRVPGRVIWCSSADRGLHWLLQIWPEIRKAVPYATLKIFYHFNYEHVENIEPNSTKDHPHLIEMAQRARYMKYAVEKLQSLGVEHVGAVSQEQLVKEFNEAEVFAFSCDTIAFSEGFSCSCLQAHASFTVPVITDQDCLGSIYKDSGCVMVKGPIKNNLNEFTNQVIKALTDKEFANERILNCREFAKKYTWKKMAERLDNII